MYTNGRKRGLPDDHFQGLSLCCRLVKATYVPLMVPASNIGSAFQSGGMFLRGFRLFVCFRKRRIIGACSQVNVQTVTQTHVRTCTNIPTHTRNKHKWIIQYVHELNAQTLYTQTHKHPVPPPPPPSCPVVLAWPCFPKRATASLLGWKLQNKQSSGRELTANFVGFAKS